MQEVSVKKIFTRDRNNLPLIFLVAAAVMLPILLYGVPYGNDIPHHYQCALTYRDAIISGDFYPSWTTLRNLGYGSMELRLYPPVSHYVLALFSLLTGEWFYATWLTFTFWWILGSLGVYFWARQLFPPNVAMVAAIAYSMMPYRLNQAYLVFFYGELAGAAILPFCFAFLARLLNERRAADEADLSRTGNHFLSVNVIGLAISYALLILTHLPLTLIVSFALGIYFLANLRFDSKAFLVDSVQFAVAILLGLAASSFFWIKILQERVLLAKTSVYEDVFLKYQLNFLITPLQHYDSATQIVYDGFTLVYDVVLLLTLLTVIPTALLAIIFRKSQKNQYWKSLWVTFLAALFLTTPASKFVWDNFSLLQEVQFPWRWLTIISLFAPMIFAAGFPILFKWFANEKLRPFALIILGTFVIGCFFGVNQSIRGAIYKDKTEMKTFVEDINRKEGFTFWWTKFVRKEAFKNLERVSAENREVEIEGWQPTDRTFQISPGNTANIRIATFYHPNWKASVNETAAEILPSEDGAMLISVPSQPSIVHLEFKETSAVQFGRWLSGLIWIMLLILCCQKFYKRNKLKI